MVSERPEDQARQLIEAVVKRPDMYVGEPRFHMARAYLDGFSQGFHLGRPDLEDEWMEFTTWLRKKRRTPPGSSPFDDIHRACPDDETALAQLASYWSDYQISKQKQPSRKKPRGAASAS
jgi:hypothetical protein